MNKQTIKDRSREQIDIVVGAERMAAYKRGQADAFPFVDNFGFFDAKAIQEQMKNSPYKNGFSQMVAVLKNEVARATGPKGPQTATDVIEFIETTRVIIPIILHSNGYEFDLSKTELLAELGNIARNHSDDLFAIERGGPARNAPASWAIIHTSNES